MTFLASLIGGLLDSRAGRWLMLAGAVVIAILLWRHAVLREARRELALQAERRARDATRRMADAAAAGPVTDDDLVARLRRGGGL
jgi:hypothetical protein